MAGSGKSKTSGLHKKRSCLSVAELQHERRKGRERSKAKRERDRWQTLLQEQEALEQMKELKDEMALKDEQVRDFFFFEMRKRGEEMKSVLEENCKLKAEVALLRAQAGFAQG